MADTSYVYLPRPCHMLRMLFACAGGAPTLARQAAHLFPHYFATTCVGKEEPIVANLQTDGGKALLHELIAGADVIV